MSAILTEQEGKICRYFNTLGGCWYGQQCKFLHIQNQKPPCRFFFSSSGCRFGDACHFSHDRESLRAVENSAESSEESATSDYKTGTNNNSMYLTQQYESDGTTDNGVIYCTTCRVALQRNGNESYYNLLRDHYLESFVEKNPDHIRNVRIRAAMEYGTLYSCKLCNLVFEKPWLLFQHCTEKAKAVRSSRLEKKLHSEWLDEVAGAMAAYDLGLFPPEQVRDSLRESLSTPAVEEEIETATNALNMCVLLNCMLNNLTAQQPATPRPNFGARPRAIRCSAANFDSDRQPDPASGDVTLNESLDGASCGFTKEEVEILLNHSIKPWDPEAQTALAAIRGEFDHLLTTNE